MDFDLNGIFANLVKGPTLIGNQMRQNALTDAQTQAIQQENQQQQMLFDQQQARQSAYNNDVSAWTRAGAPANGLMNLIARYPGQYQALKAGWDAKDTAQRTADLQYFGNVHAALDNGKPDIAARVIADRIAAEQKAGIDTTADQQLLSGIQAGDPDAINTIKAFALGNIAAATGPDKFASTFKAIGGNGGGDIEGKVVGNSIGHYEGNKFVVDYTADKPEYRTVKNADGSESIVRVQGGGGQASGGAGGVGGSGAPRSVRNNNPGNLKASAFTKGLPGYAGTDSGGFAVFDSPQAGANAQAALLGNYIDRGYNTVGKIIGRWAPPSDGNDTGAYVRSVAQALGVKPGDTISKDRIPQLQAAIARVEGGPGASSGVPSSNGVSEIFRSDNKGGEAAFDDDTIKIMAQQYLAGDKSVFANLGRGAQGAQNIARLRKEIRVQAQAGGMSGRDVAAQIAAFSGDLAAQRAAGTRLAAIEVASTEADKLIPLALQASQRLSRSGFLPFGRAQEMLRNNTNDPLLRSFVAANNSLINVYARALSPSGVPSVTDKEHARQMLDTAHDQASYAATIHQMRAEIQAARQSPIDVRRDLYNAVGSAGRPQPPQPPQGSSRVGTYQGKAVYQLPNGRRVMAQ